MKKYLISLALALTLIVGVSQAKAVTMEELMAELASLKQELSSLKSSMGALTLSGYLNTDTALKATTTSNLTATKTIAPTTVTATSISPTPDYQEINAGDSCTANFLVPPDYNSWGTYTGAYVSAGYGSDGGELFSCEPLAKPSLVGQPCAVKNSDNSLSKGTWVLSSNGKTILCKTSSSSLLNNSIFTSTPKTIVQTLDQSPCPSTNPDCKSVMPKQVTTNTNTTSTPAGLNLTKNLAYGLMNNIEVKKLQDFLISQGYLQTGLNSGNYLGKTVSALQAFQKANNIQGNGRSVGPMTRNALLSGLTATPRPTVLPQRVCRTTDAPWVQVTSPNGNEVYTAGQQITVTWRSCNVPANAQVGIVFDVDPSAPQQYAFTLIPSYPNFVTMNDGSETVTIPASVYFSSLGQVQIHGLYKARIIYIINNNTSTVISDSSDNLFTVNAPNTGPHSKVFLIGGSKSVLNSQNLYYNDVYLSDDLINWRLISPNDPNPRGTKWTQRSGQTALYFKNKLWVIGGQDSQGNASNEVWSSSDGSSWNLTGSLGNNFHHYRSGHTSIVFNNKMWVFGGHTGVSLWNDVYSSVDGITWVQETSSAPWNARQGHISFAFRDRMWLMGGISSVGLTLENDVWSSVDGVNWTLVSNNNIWAPRVGLMGGVYNNKMYIFGGADSSLTTLNDVYSSSDGVNWVKEANAPWGARSNGGSVVTNNKLYVLGGGFQNFSQYKDVWSFDGQFWQSLTLSPSWSERSKLNVVAAE